MMFESPSKKRWNNMLSSSSASSYRETIVLGRYSKSCREPKQQQRREKERVVLPKWKVLLMKLKLLPSSHRSSSSSSSTKVVAYEAYDYSLNFDQGPGWHDHDEPENLSRSFSCRFADPTKIRATRLLLY
ncbi:hypothetical protein CARUB_v10024318mg [Capsella rubella]|uniref:Uncharacterized protein n=1 Tax=Capsella rubella TaxID=81985 RepID=R0HS17_9BRAS|nr:uncharacterized protein LOC17887615 [Capsella rubella]EOA28130.1 hypothetical protein CARUB_v10024318mg [Capsella rubella]